MKLVLTDLTYKFLGSIPCSEPLSARGRRLNDTAAQRQEKTYAPDVSVEIETEERRQRLDASFVEDEEVLLLQGERKGLELWINNTGVEDVNEVWMVSGSEDVVWIENSASERQPGENLTEKKRTKLIPFQARARRFSTRQTACRTLHRRQYQSKTTRKLGR